MAPETARYLTVTEVAELLRVAPQTVYRWCRAGKLAAVKYGKGWRIPAAAVGQQTELTGLMPLDELLGSLAHESDHLIGLTCDKLALGRLEATFFEVGAARGARLVHGRWHEDVDTLRRRLRPVVRSARNGDGVLQLLDFLSSYEEQGAEGVASLLVAESQRALAEGVPCVIYGSPYAYFGYHLDRLTSYERQVDQSLRGERALTLCGYALNELLPLYEGRAVSFCAALMSCHTGVVWFDGQQALFHRPAGVPR